MGTLCALFLNVGNLQAATDTDGDTLPDEFELLVGSAIDNKNTDGDGYTDDKEVMRGYDPVAKEKKKLEKSWFTLDTDNDGLSDLEEITLETERENPDTDGDGYSDGVEIKNGFDPKSSDPAQKERYVAVSIANQTLTYYSGDYIVSQFKISTGRPGHDTPKGNFTVLKKLPLVDYIGKGYSYPKTKWNLRFKPSPIGNYYIHGAFWHDEFGKKKSAGCVNVAYPQMERLYNFAHEGMRVTIQ